MSNRTFTCIICPNGCRIETTYDGDAVLRINGNKCKRGEEYARQELTDPRRTIASTVRIQGASLPLCSVRLTRPIPKADIFRVMEQINQVDLVAPVQAGQIVIARVCGQDSDVIVTRTMEQRSTR